METLAKIVNECRLLIPLFLAYPRSAQVLLLVTILLLVVCTIVFVKLFPAAKAKLDPLNRPRLETRLSTESAKQLRDVISPYELKATGSLLHVVWGSIADVRDMVVVIPVNQSLDLEQRGPKSVLNAFESHRINGKPFFDFVGEQWPTSERQTNAPLGTTHYLPLPSGSHGLKGVIFAVTTRNQSTSTQDYGLYTNTPMGAIDYAVGNILEICNNKEIEAMAMPLVGTGYANIGRTYNNPELNTMLQHAGALITIQKFIKVLSDKNSRIRRGVVVIYSSSPQSESEHSLFRSVSNFISASDQEKEKILSTLKSQIDGNLHEKP